jgi:undecaprenyl-phosphate 4-deoxy-4-formamido-L-arabinose transferase
MRAATFDQHRAERHITLEPGLSIVIPVYNSGPALPLLHQALLEEMPNLGMPFEVIFVEDHGSDDSWAVIRGLAAGDPRVRGLRMNRNFGQHAALLCGIREARFDRLVTMDDDLQHHPRELGKLLAALTDEIDVVYGSPERERHGLLRDMASILTKSALASAMGHGIAHEVSALRLFRTHLRDAFADYHNPSVSVDVLLSWATNAFAAIRVPHHERAFGASNYTLSKLVKHALNMTTGFGTAPLHFATTLGFLFTLVGFVLFLYVFVRAIFFGSPVQGFPFLASAISMFSGVQLLSLGIIGEYVGRIFERTGSRPAYFVSQATPPHDAAARRDNLPAA